MAKRTLPDIALIRNRVGYQPDTGELTWLPRRPEDFQSGGSISQQTRAKQWNTRCSGKPAFNSVAPTGYLVGPFGSGIQLAAHRVAFAIQNGRWPSMIDHINGDRTDNRWLNLREVTPRQNAMNCAVRSDSSTGRTGVQPNRRRGRGFVATIKAEGRHLYLGTYGTFDEAVAAREAAEKVLGYSARHGRS